MLRFVSMNAISWLMELTLTPYLVITFFVWIAYCYTVKCGFVSDDLAGIAEYDGKLQGKEYGMISRWIRFHLCGGLFPSKHTVKNQDGSDYTIPQGKIPLWHHVLSVSVFNIACLLLYAFLASKFGVKTALLTTILFAVHPIGTQAVAWPSGLGYPLSLVWGCLALNLVGHVYSNPSTENIIFGAILFCLLQFLAIHAQFATMMLWSVLLFFGYWQFSILGLCISIAMGFDIIKHTILFRADEFKKQQMASSTFLKPRKIVVALKTFIYYLKHTFWPHPVGLYHVWGFHYGPDLERKDWKFIRGLLAAIGLLGIFLLTPSQEIKLSILWFVAFIGIFLNWVTIQQFVTERYAFIPTIGACLLIAYFTKDLPIAFAFILGAYLVRTWHILPQYDNELRFYQFNNWEFPKSEVALGNLGVTQLRMGWIGSAMDTWQLATRVNPDYDVPYYNIFSNYRANAEMAIRNGDYVGGINAYRQALPYLEKTLSCKVCHFPDMWKKDHESLLNILRNPAEMLKQEKERLIKLGEELSERLSKLDLKDDVRPIQLSIDNNNAQLQRLENFLKQNNIT